MLKYLPLLFLYLLPLISYAQESDWKVFHSYEGKFKIEVPGGLMLEKERVIYTDIGEITYVTHYYQPAEKEVDNALYLVSYCDYPLYSIHSDSTALLEDFFNNTITSAKESVFGELRYSESINYVDYPGKLFRIDYLQGTATLKSKTFLVNNRFYNVQIATTRGKSLNNAADKFLDSFHLIEEVRSQVEK